ncbi:hypothetical protein BL107_05929 [Synechococcus sp. BL107]|uniref:hypothetical protein n=1 Tax=Synechococcus sp. BL107 TaxID=313625 RepID=UPI0000E53B68|nr:hypothetical protein [Synechococcus sp. BL107]EAU71045.1 hypothetical protein BL107_05929 [Synechococcus sp. BL107]
MRTVNFFIPHYKDHNRLLFQLKLCESVYKFRRRYIIYDSTPEPIAHDLVRHQLKNADLIFKHCKYDLNENTYNYVIRDFMLSKDSDDGAFILPHDELLLLNYDHFNELPESIPFSCGKQISFCPETKKVAEFRLAYSSGLFSAQDYKPNYYVPQYHSTYFPGLLIKPLGIFFKDFMEIWGSKNAAFVGFVQFSILRQLNMFYSEESVYLQEKLMKRKTSGQFTHPSIFIKSLSISERERLFQMVVKLFDKILILSSRHQKKELENLFDTNYLQKSFLMSENDRHQYLFRINNNQKHLINFERIDIFSGYHSINEAISPEFIDFFFDGGSCLSSPYILSSLLSMINSY